MKAGEDMENNDALALFDLIPAEEAVGRILAHDVTEIRKGEFKGRAFKKGHIVCTEDIAHLKRLGKERLYVYSARHVEGFFHENDAARLLSEALAGEGVYPEGEPKEGKINLLAGRDGLLKVDRDALFALNMSGEVMCASLHTNTVVAKGKAIAATRAIPLMISKEIMEGALSALARAKEKSATFAISVQELRKARAGIVITGKEVYDGTVTDAFSPVIVEKLAAYDATIVDIHYAPDDPAIIEGCLRDLLAKGADLLITTGGMSVDPDDVTRFAIRSLNPVGFHYGTPVLPGSMFLLAYIEGTPMIPVLGIPACGMYHRTTIFDLILPRVLAGEVLDRSDLAELGHGGLCLYCETCRYPVCPFGK